MREEYGRMKRQGRRKEDLREDFLKKGRGFAENDAANPKPI
jgi:hypothetical protein